MHTIHLQKEISGFTQQGQPSSGHGSEPPRAGSGLITGSTTGQRSFAPSQPLTWLMPKVHWPRQKAELVISLGLHINPSSEKLTFSPGLKYPSCLISEMFTLQNTVMHRWRDSCSHISCGNWFLWDLLPVGLILLHIFCKRNLPDSSAQHFADTMLKGTGIMNFMPEGY